MKILTHSANLEWFKKYRSQEIDVKDLIHNKLFGLEIVTDNHLPQFEKTGKYILSNGQVIERGDLWVNDGPYFEWGNSDWEIKLMLEWGWIKEHQTPLFYILDDWNPHQWIITDPIAYFTSPSSKTWEHPFRREFIHETQRK